VDLSADCRIVARLGQSLPQVLGSRGVVVVPQSSDRDQHLHPSWSGPHRFGQCLQRGYGSAGFAGDLALPRRAKTAADSVVVLVAGRQRRGQLQQLRRVRRRALGRGRTRRDIQSRCHRGGRALSCECAVPRPRLRQPDEAGRDGVQLAQPGRRYRGGHGRGQQRMGESQPPGVRYEHASYHRGVHMRRFSTRYDVLPGGLAGHDSNQLHGLQSARL
jgi:hypothetical protein